MAEEELDIDSLLNSINNNLDIDETDENP